MCGIAGVWDFVGKGETLGAAIDAITRLRHRGPDDEGYLVVGVANGSALSCSGPRTDPRLRLPRIEELLGSRCELVLGHQRLAILDLTVAGHQPMASADGKQWIVYNGEVFNYRELRQELEDEGVRFSSGTDTEVLLAAYGRWGADCLVRLNGMWAFAIWDASKRRLFLARDRFGVKPLYWTNSGDRFAFASEIKSLVGRCGLEFKPDAGVVIAYVAANYQPDERSGETFFEGIRALPAGHYLSVERGRIEMRRFYEIPECDVRPLGGEDAAEEFRELFTDALRLRLRSDVPVGSCLSGGVDSSSIVCTVSRLLEQEGAARAQIGDRQRVFSAVYESTGRYNERPRIERVLAATGAGEDFVFPDEERLASELEKLVWHQDEPFQGTSVFAQWCVMARVKERGVKVLLDGQGADEVLAGYRPFVARLSDLIDEEGLGGALREARAIERVTGLAAVRLLGHAMTWRAPGFLRRGVGTAAAEAAVADSGLRREVAGRFLDKERKGRSRRPQKPGLDWQLREMMARSPLPALLRYEDRNSMAFSVEARVPFLDYRLVEFAFGRGAPWRLHAGWTKWLLRSAMDGLVPPEVLWFADKVGFETPEEKWLRRLVVARSDLLEGSSLSAEYLDPKVVRTRVGSFLAGRATSGPIWRWLNLEAWLRGFRAA